MLIFLRGFLIAISSYHIINTILVYGVFGADIQTFFALSKEIIWFVFLIIIALINFKSLISFMRKYIYILLILCGILIWSVLISFFYDKGLFDIIVGVKYNIYYLFILLGALFVGHILAYQKQGTKVHKFFDYIFQLILWILIISLIWQAAKFIFPDLFYWLGYGPVGDYIQGQSPPLYYRTGPGGLARFSGIFAGPNNIGYFLVLFFGFFLSYMMYNNNNNNKKNIFEKILYGILYIFTLIFTFSRGAILGVVLQIYIIISIIWKINTKIRIGLALAFFGLLFIMITLKGGSSIQHFDATLHGIDYYLSNPLGYGLGTAGPAVHYGGAILPENIFLQLLIDIGSIGFMLWVLFMVILFGIIQKCFIANSDQKLTLYLKFLSFGLIGLLLEGLFLHVFEDSMVNYIFFISFGVLLGYLNGISKNKT